MHYTNLFMGNGRLVAKPTYIKKRKNALPIARFELSMRNSHGDEFIMRCVCFGDYADDIKEMRKGRAVMVSGQIVITVLGGDELCVCECNTAFAYDPIGKSPVFAGPASSCLAWQCDPDEPLPF